VLEDTRAAGADAYWALGDLAAIGPEPVAVLELLATLSGARIEHRRVAYDRDAFVEAVRRSRHPETEFILSSQRCEKRGRTPYTAN
jgi:hypothetical protein